MPAILKFPVISLTRRLMKLKENNFQGITFSNLSFFFFSSQVYANQLPLKSCCGGRGSDDWVSCPGVGGITLETNKGPPGSWLWLPRRTLIQIIILITCFLSQVISQRVIIICVAYSRLPITRTLKGNRKKVRVNGSSKKIAESKVKKKQFLLHSEHFNHI